MQTVEIVDLNPIIEGFIYRFIGSEKQ